MAHEGSEIVAGKTRTAPVQWGQSGGGQLRQAGCAFSLLYI